MNHAALRRLPGHITHVRQGNLIFVAEANWQPIEFPTIGAAKRFVRTSLHCKGGPRSFVRTAKSLDLE